jgi:hypothetical protein
MCRNIKMLFNFDPPVTPDEVNAASLQFVRKISGFNKPSKANEQAFLSAVQEIAAISTRLLNLLETNAPVRNRKLNSRCSTDLNLFAARLGTLNPVSRSGRRVK